MDEYLADAATDTLYKNAFLRVCLVSLLFFFLVSCCLELFVLLRFPCLMLISPFPCKLLSSGQTEPDLKCEDPRLSPRRRSGSPAARCLTDCCRNSVSMPLLTLQLAGREWAPPRVCHQELSRSVGVRRRSAGLSAPLKSEHECRGPESLCIWARWRDGGDVEMMNCSLCCLLFCPTSAC